MKRFVVSETPQDLSISSYKLIFTPTKVIARSLYTPHFTLDSIAEKIVKKQGFRIASILLTKHLLQDAIAKVLKVKDVSGITSLWLPVIQEILSSGCDLLALQKHSLVRVQQLAKVTIFYREQLQKLNCIDRQQLFWEAAKYCQRREDCLFYGYFIISRNRLSFINALAGNNSLLVLPDEEHHLFTQNRQFFNWLQDREWQIKAVNSPSNVRYSLGDRLQQSYLNNRELPSKVRLHCYPNLEAEVRGVLTEIKLLLAQKINPRDIVITTKDERLYGTVLLDIAWEYDIPLRAFYDIFFIDTRFGAWLQLLLEIITDFNRSGKLSFEAVIKLLSHPLVKQLSPEIWNKARLDYPQSIAEWQLLNIDLSLLKLPQLLSKAEWLERWQNILDFFTIAEKIKPWAKEILAYYKFQDSLKELLLDKDTTIEREIIIGEIQELLTSLTIPIQPGRGGVEIHPPSSLFGSKYRYVFVLGMAENIFPTQVTDDLVLNYRDRKLLETENIPLNTIVNLTRQEALSFYFLLGVPTEQITFSYPQLLERQATNISPFLANLKLALTAKENNYLASIEEVRKVYLRQTEKIDKEKQGLIKDLVLCQNKWQIERNREQTIKDIYNGLIGIPLDYQKFTFSASQLTQIGQCPFKWFAARLLKLKEIAETKLSLENNIRGSLYHYCLELCLAEVNTAADLENFNLQQLERAFTAAETKLQIPDIPSWSDRKQELLNLLKINLTTPDFLPSDSEIIDRERDFTIEWYGLKTKGKIDRLDRTSQGIKVIDYKSSSTPPTGIKDESGKAIIDLQIPLYIDAMAQEYPQETVEAMYYSLSSCQPIKRSKSNPEDLAKFAERVKQYLTNGNYPIEPDIQFKSCNYCQFDLVCRKQNFAP